MPFAPETTTEIRKLAASAVDGDADETIALLRAALSEAIAEQEKADPLRSLSEEHFRLLENDVFSPLNFEVSDLWNLWTANWSNRDFRETVAETVAFEANVDEIGRRFSNEAAQNANCGWSVSGDDDHVSCATKVYGHGVLVTNVSYDDLSVEHRFDED